MGLILKDPFESWEEYYCWENCKLGNKKYGQFLASYIKSQKKSLTVNINGQWGVGKTHFLRQLYSQTRFQDKVPSIYINAWESDFSKDPLLVIVSEFLEQVKLVDSSQHLKGLINYAFEKFKWLTNKSVKLIGGVASLATQKELFTQLPKIYSSKKRIILVIYRHYI